MYYKKLNIDNFERIQDTLVPYITHFISQKEKLFYNLISKDNLQEFKKNIPELFECIEETLKSEIIFASYLFVDRHTDVPIHTDASNPAIQKRIRLNWPILNGSSAETVIYQKNHEDIPGVVHSHPWGTGTHYDMNECHEVDKYVLDVPTLMNVKELHGVRILNDKLPRILLSMRLSNEEEVYRKYFN
jgi:hypothetical protein